MSVEGRIQAAASQNTALLAVLAETDYAPPSLQQQKHYITDLEGETKTLAKQIKSLEAKRAKELKEHESYRDSVMKRFTYKISGKKEKFQARASKEEREYFDALNEEHKAKEVQKDVAYRLEEANKVRTELESVVSRRAQAQQELDALYDSIFEGPTPEFPEEDERENAARAALQLYHDLRVKADSEGQAVALLNDAQSKMKTAMLAMREAQDYSRMDMFGGGTVTDMMERNALSKAEVLVAQCQTSIAQAQRMSAAVQPLPPVNIAQGNIMSDVFFDNIFTDMAFHEKIKQSIVEVERAASALDQQVALAKQRHAGMSQELLGAGRALEDSRVSLQNTREMAFERVLNGRV